MKASVLVALFLTGGFVLGQEARIMIVDKSDSQTLATAYKDYKAAQKRWEDLKAATSKKYTTEDGKVTQGWEHVQFSADFRAIVPASSEYAYRGSNLCQYGWVSPASSPASSFSGINGTSSLALTPSFANLAVNANTDLMVDNVRTDLKTVEPKAHYDDLGPVDTVPCTAVENKRLAKSDEGCEPVVTSSKTMSR